ncbi:FliI/YscN family ATPase [Tahibacter soli]|uniref:Flagellum-specific ATP synthase n=1 Tax=Tahibacter soli TaxID=2983605 RepID=A0A9X4BHH7_9GAMM|nr:FliI/YscN family ATPase [Tahibacter soli]MDC8012866.1 FliI/YscN family ATPase [Tahibacter soli]
MNLRTEWQDRRDARIVERLSLISTRPPAREFVREGVLKRVVGLTVEAAGCEVPLGAQCRVETADGSWIEAEVVGFSGDRTFLMPSGELHGLIPNARVVPSPGDGLVGVGEALLGRVIDGEGVPLDGRGEPHLTGAVPLQGPSINPLQREPISAPLDVGVRAINALLPIGRGQRVGLFAGSGVGKSTLLGMMTRHTTADVIVVGLIGERGREVRDFVERTLGQMGLSRAVVVATPADRPPLARLHGAWRATAIAEWFRSRGNNVLLLMDSLTRFAQAQREIGLSVGEPPTTRGYPPSVFARLPQLVERAGNGNAGEGSITAFYTVLTEGDDPHEPISDAARAILDGHIVLSRAVAESGRYPAIDVEASISRLASELTDPAWRDRIRRVRRLMSAYSSNRDLIAIGAYQRGADPRVDEALRRWPALTAFLEQDVEEAADVAGSRAALARLIDDEGAA